MFKKPNATAISTLEAELTSLQRRRASLQDRHDRAEAALEAAKAARRAILTSEDDPAPAKLAAADKAVREADDARQAAAEAGQEIGALIETASTRLATVLEAEQREQRAAEMDTNAKAAEAAIERIRKAVKEIASAHKALAEAVGPAAALYTPSTNDPDQSWKSYLGTKWFTTHGDRTFTDVLTAEQVADRMAGHILAPVLPSCVITTESELNKPTVATRVGLRPLTAGDDIRNALVEPMRNHAAALRDGAAPLPALAPPMPRSEIAKSSERPLPDVYKVGPDGQRLDLDGNPLDEADTDEVAA